MFHASNIEVLEQRHGEPATWSTNSTNNQALTEPLQLPIDENATVQPTLQKQGTKQATTR